MSADRQMEPDRSAREQIPHAAAMAALDELDYRKQNGRFPIEQVKDAVAAALSAMEVVPAAELGRSVLSAGDLRAEVETLKGLYDEMSDVLADIVRYPRRSHPGFAAVSYDHKPLALHERALATLKAAARQVNSAGASDEIEHGGPDEDGAS